MLFRSSVFGSRLLIQLAYPDSRLEGTSDWATRECKAVCICHTNCVTSPGDAKADSQMASQMVAKFLEQDQLQDLLSANRLVSRCILNLAMWAWAWGAYPGFDKGAEQAQVETTAFLEFPRLWYTCSKRKQTLQALVPSTETSLSILPLTSPSLCGSYPAHFAQTASVISFVLTSLLAFWIHEIQNGVLKKPGKKN